MKKTAAIYARVSSDRQKEENTIASQTALLREYAQGHDYAVPPEWVFEDAGYSGSVLARPGLERLRDLAAEGQIEAILIYAPDRLSRKYAYQILLLEEFARHGVEVVFLKAVAGETPEERLLLQFQGMIAEYERAQIAERSRRGKRHRAREGCVNVLSGAPYGYRYMKKTQEAQAYYAVLEAEAEVVRQVFGFYTQEQWSIGAIARYLNERGTRTRTGKCLWERSTIWGLLKNPAYQGTACFGKTEACERQRLTRPLRQRGGYSPRRSANRMRPRDQWIEIAIPALVDPATFALAQERLAQNRHFSARHTKTPTLLQGLLVCGQCGYAIYRTSTCTSKQRLGYYRCLGSDRYRHLKGPVCACRPLRQDYLDDLVWRQVLQLLHSPQLVQAEIERRIRENVNSSPAQKRKDNISGELKRIQQQIDKLLDAYQEDLLSLGELRKRAPELKKRQTTLEKELQNVTMQALEQNRLRELNTSLENFLATLERSAHTLNITERQKIVRLVVKDIIVKENTITINHCLPVTGGPVRANTPSYRLCTRGALAVAGQYLPGRAGPRTGTTRTGIQPVCGRLQHLREQPSGGRTSISRRHRMDQATPPVGSQRGQERGGATVGTEVPGISHQPGREDRSRPQECGTIQAKGSGILAELPESEQ
jgi:site-specific DNA recombinase